MKVEVAVLGSPSLIVIASLYGLCGRKATIELEDGDEFRSCVKVEVDVLGSPSLTVRTVSVDVIAKLNFDSSFKQRSEAV